MMFEGEIGVKAAGLSVSQYLLHGVPGGQTAEAVIADIDEQLIENGAQIEECIKSLLEMTTDLAGDEHNFLHPVDAIHHMTEQQLLEKMACYNPNGEAVNKMLKRVQSVLEEHKGCEEAVLQHLLQLTSKEGMCLPQRTSSQATASMLSINTATDDSEHANQNLWNDITMKLRRFFIDKLSKLPVGCVKSPITGAGGDERLRYIQSLCSLFPAEDIWQRYKSLRIHQLDACLLCSRHANQAPDTFMRAVSHFSELTPRVQRMVDEDYTLLNSGVFGGHVTTLQAIQDIYTERLMEEVTATVGILQQEMGDALGNKPRAKDTNSKEMAKSSSEFGFMNQFKGNLRRQQSKSLDSLLMKTEDSFTDLQATPLRHVDSVVVYVELLLDLEKFLKEIYSALMWEAMPKPTKSLKSALKGSQQQAMADGGKKGLFSPRSFEQSGILPEAIPPPFGATPAMVAHMTDSLRVVEKPCDVVPSWEWRPVWRSLAPDLAKCVDGHVRGVGEVSLQLLDVALETGQLSSTPLPQSRRGVSAGVGESPNEAAKEVLVLVSELERLIPLAQIAGSIKATLVDSATFILKNIHVKLSKLGSVIDEKFPVGTHYQVLSNAVLLRNHLNTMQQALEEPATERDAKPESRPLSMVYKQYNELVEKITSRVIEHHIHLFTTSLLHDAESNYWGDSKEFYENERCSFSISMWGVHMWLLHEDLWNVCPPQLARDIYLTVLHDSLSMICRRYVRIQPSYRRTQQYRQDIVSILVVVSELLVAACGHSGQYLCPSSNERMLFGIHSFCGSLLAAMAIVCSPIDTLYRVYKKGFQKKAVRREDEELRGYMSQWLSWLRPGLLPPGQYSLDALQTTSALYVQLRLLDAQPPAALQYGCLPLVMQSLLMKECALSIMLLTQTGQQKEKESVVTEVFHAITGILLQSGASFPGALTTAIMPVLDMEGGWEVLTGGPDTQIPVWLESILHHIDSFIVRCVEPGLRVLLARNLPRPEVPSLLDWMDTLPCGCTPHKDTQQTKAEGGANELWPFSFEAADLQQQGSSSKDILAESLYSVVTQLTEDLFGLPTPVVMLLHTIQQAAEKKEDVNISHDCAGLKILAVGLRRLFMDIDRLECMIGERLDDNLVDYVRMMGECIYYVLTATSYSKSSGIPRIAGQFMKANRNWLREQIDTTVEHMNNNVFELDCPELLEDSSPDFLSQQLSVITNTVLAAPKGLSWLRSIQYLIKNNLSWLLGQLDVAPLLPLITPPTPSFLLDTSQPPPHLPLGPLQIHDTVAGYIKFDHAAIAELPWNWAALLQSDLGLTEPAFRALLFHRHEMQDGAYLEETEMKPVQTLRNKFDGE